MNIKHAMVGHLKNPISCFKEVIQGHFKYKKEKILETCEGWLKEEKEGKDVMYDGLVELHNKDIANKYKGDSTKFAGDLMTEIIDLKKELNKLNLI